MRGSSYAPPGDSVPRAAGAMPVDVARQPFGADRGHQPLHRLRAATRARRARLCRARQILLETRVARLAPIFVDRHLRPVYSSPPFALELLRSICERQGVSPEDADL